MTPDEALAAAWTYCAPGRLKQPELPYGGFPTGFWPDVARVAVEMIMQDTFEPQLNFRPARYEQNRVKSAEKKKVDLSQLEI